MEKIRFFNAFCEISQALWGQEEGMRISNQFENHSAEVIANIELDHSSPCYDFLKITRVLTYFDYHILTEKIGIFWLPFPYREGVGLLAKGLKDFWPIRRLFYSGNGKASIGAEDKRQRYELILSQNILDPLIQDSASDTRVYNYGQYSTHYKCEIDRVYHEFVTQYGAGFRQIGQKEFLDFVQLKITTSIADHDLKCLWRSFYAGKLDIFLESDEDDNDQNS